ncbi:cadherin-related family member 3-like [Cetorhinus maximus]
MEHVNDILKQHFPAGICQMGAAAHFAKDEQKSLLSAMCFTMPQSQKIAAYEWKKTETFRLPKDVTTWELVHQQASDLWTPKGHIGGPPGVTFTCHSEAGTSADTITSVDIRAVASISVTVSENPGLDYETQSIYALLIYVVDDKGNADFQMLTVLLSDVNEPPRFLDNLANRVVYVDFLENLAVGAMIYEVQATDPDRDDDILSYSVNSSMVTIISNGKNGAILAAKTFDYEKDFHSFNVLVTVKDATGNSISGIVVVNIINVNDNWPVFTQNKTVFEISEEKPPGSVIGKVTAYDSDDDGASSRLTYAMNTANQYFTINSVTGELIVLAIIDRDNGPFRHVPTQEFEVFAKDRPSGGHTASLTVIIIIQDINDNQPFCFPHTHSIQIPETTKSGTTIVTISCEDNDADFANSQFTFSLQPGLRTNGRFALNGKNNNTIAVIGNLNFEAVTNLEDSNVYVILIAVTDIAPPYYQDTVTVYVTVTPVNEFRPSFTQTSYTFNISEFSEIGTKVGRVLAEDKDFPGLELIYSLIGGGSTLGYSQLFWINPISGEIHIVAQPDYEATVQYLLTVQAVDKDSNDPKATTTVTVNILPTNDEPPACQPKFYSLFILDGTAVGTNIQGFQLSCTDLDSSPQSFRYFITSGNINNHFRLSPSAGSNITKLILGLPFDYTHGVDKVTNYNLLVQITDDNLLAGSGQRKVVQTGRVKINVRIIIPTPSTQETTTPQPNITYIRLAQNTYQTDAWYIPFIITLGCLLLLGMLGYLAYLLAEYIQSIPKSKVEKRPTMDKQAPKPKKQHNVILEMVTRNTIFDGEAVDPVTGNVYQYNTNSGARRWKDIKLPVNAQDAAPNFTSNINKTNETNVTQSSNIKNAQTDQDAMQKADNDQPSPKPPPKLGKQNKVAPEPPEAPQTLSLLANA